MRVLIAGDYYPNSRAIPFVKNNNTCFVDSSIRELIKSSDCSIINFECPIVDDLGSRPILKSGPNLKTASYAALFLKELGFKMATLANNHTLDYGEESLLFTKKYLEEIGIHTVGAGKNLKDAEKTRFITIEGKTLAVINCCEHEYSIAKDDSAGTNPLNPIKQFNFIKEARKKADFVLLIVHGGNEHYQLPSPRMQETYRFFIEQGADVVINHHQHCPCGYEVWKGKPIFYGIGNFCFDSLCGKHIGSSLWNYGMLVEIVLSGDFSFSIHPFIQFGETPVIELLKGSDKDEFMRSIDSLNEIIYDPKKVKESYETAMIKMSQGLKFLFTPWQGRFFRKLLDRRIIPSLMAKQKTVIFHNCFQCESQLDKIRILLDSLYETYH